MFLYSFSFFQDQGHEVRHVGLAVSIDISRGKFSSPEQIIDDLLFGWDRQNHYVIVSGFLVGAEETGHLQGDGIGSRCIVKMQGISQGAGF